MQYQIGNWLVIPDTGVLRNEEKETRLTPHEMDVLVYLALRPNEVVAIEEILEEVWPDIVTGDYTVYNAISSLRKALNDTDQPSVHIKTIPKRAIS